MTWMKMNNDSQPVAVIFLIKHFFYYSALQNFTNMELHRLVEKNSKINTNGEGPMSDVASSVFI